MLSDWELWACAQRIIGDHGADAGAFARERIAALDALCDSTGMATWRAITQRIKQLTDIEVAGNSMH